MAWCDLPGCSSPTRSVAPVTSTHPRRRRGRRSYLATLRRPHKPSSAVAVWKTLRGLPCAKVRDEVTHLRRKLLLLRRSCFRASRESRLLHALHHRHSGPVSLVPGKDAAPRVQLLLSSQPAVWAAREGKWKSTRAICGRRSNWARLRLRRLERRVPVATDRKAAEGSIEKSLASPPVTSSLLRVPRPAVPVAGELPFPRAPRAEVLENGERAALEPVLQPGRSLQINIDASALQMESTIQDVRSSGVVGSQLRVEVQVVGSRSPTGRPTKLQACAFRPM